VVRVARDHISQGFPVFDLATRRKINKGFSDGFTRAVEIVATPVLLGFIGAAVDGWLGTRPLSTLALATFGVCGIVAKLWLGYDREMRVEEANVPAARSGARVANAAPAPVDMRLDAGIAAHTEDRTADRTDDGTAGRTADRMADRTADRSTGSAAPAPGGAA
jgi:hypothetical protein